MGGSVWVKYRVLVDEEYVCRGGLGIDHRGPKPSRLKYLETYHKEIIQNLHYSQTDVQIQHHSYQNPSWFLYRN